jgi:hypothetical protein
MSMTAAPPYAQSAAGTSVATIQGLFYLATGVWPLLHIDSFMAVTGPKTDLWLVYTVGILVAAIGAVLLMSARSGRITPEVMSLAVLSAAGLTAIDVIFVVRQVILPIYLADAAVELLLIGWWLFSQRRG